MMDILSPQLTGKWTYVKRTHKVPVWRTKTSKYPKRHKQVSDCSFHLPYRLLDLGRLICIAKFQGQGL